MYNRIVMIALTIAVVGYIKVFSPAVAASGELPNGWRKAGSHPKNFEMTLDTSVKRGGKAAARIESTAATPKDGFGTLMQNIKADGYRGKRLRMSAWMKTESANSAQLWMRLDGVKRMLGFDNMDGRPVKGTTGWKRYEITLDVPESAVNIAFGFFVIEKGKAWADDFLLEAVGKDVPPTNMLHEKRWKKNRPQREIRREYSEQPVNLDFEN